MKPRMLNVLLMASMAVAMSMALAGCGDDNREYGRDRHPVPDRERRDSDRRDSDRRDEPRDSGRHDDDAGRR